MVGSGYVGMSLSVLLAQHNDVTVLDIDVERVNKINNKESTIADSDIDLFLSERDLDLSADGGCKNSTLDKVEGIFSTHPSDCDRVSQANEWMDRYEGASNLPLHQARYKAKLSTLK